MTDPRPPVQQPCSPLSQSLGRGLPLPYPSPGRPGPPNITTVNVGRDPLASIFSCLFFGFVFGTVFFVILASVLRPKTAPKSIKIVPETRSGSRRRSVTVFLRFLVDFRGLRTSKIVLSPTPEHDFRKIAVFVFGPHFGQIFGDFTSVLDPKSQQKHLRKRFRENLGFRSPFLLVFHDFWTPFGTPFRTQNHLKIA